ncbi:MAG: 4Fe-4S binding protein, partial [Gemmatimonadaceae bacterium]
RQVRLALTTGRATLAYPFAPHPAEPEFRGRIRVNTDRCVGCGGCADVCPSRCILVTDVSPFFRVISRHLDRCILCGRCETACAFGAITIEPDYETSTPDRADLHIEQRLFMGACERCGRCYTPRHPLDGLKRTGMRTDETWRIEQEAV